MQKIELIGRPAGPAFLLNGKPFKIVGDLAINSDGRAIALQDRPREGRWGL